MLCYVIYIYIITEFLGRFCINSDTYSVKKNTYGKEGKHLLDGIFFHELMSLVSRIGEYTEFTLIEIVGQILCLTMTYYQRHSLSTQSINNILTNKYSNKFTKRQYY